MLVVVEAVSPEARRQPALPAAPATHAPSLTTDCSEPAPIDRTALPGTVVSDVSSGVLFSKKDWSPPELAGVPDCGSAPWKTIVTCSPPFHVSLWVMISWSFAVEPATYPTAL